MESLTKGLSTEVWAGYKKPKSDTKYSTLGLLPPICLKGLEEETDTGKKGECGTERVLFREAVRFT